MLPLAIIPSLASTLINNHGTGVKNPLVFSSDGKLFAAWDTLYSASREFDSTGDELLEVI